MSAARQLGSGARDVQVRGHFCQERGFEGARCVPFLRLGPERAAAASPVSGRDIVGREETRLGRLGLGRGGPCTRKRCRRGPGAGGPAGPPGSGGRSREAGRGRAGASLGGKPSPAGAHPLLSPG